MASSSLGYRYKKEFTKMEKPYSHPLFDASSIESYSKLSNMNPKFLSGNHKLRSNLVFLHDEMEVQDHCNSSKKQKLNRIGMVPTNNLKTKNYTKFDKGSSKKTSNHHRFDLNVSPPGSNGDNASYHQEDLSSPSEQISHDSLTTKFELGCGSSKRVPSASSRAGVAPETYDLGRWGPADLGSQACGTDTLRSYLISISRLLENIDGELTSCHLYPLGIVDCALVVAGCSCIALHKE
ncbi:hypothetical protein L1887_16331 [Cichorium endivia]|nr:hypothetical protein L1887_16331 [Cichorium endivia]